MKIEGFKTCSTHAKRWLTAVTLAVPLIATLGWAPVSSWVVLVIVAAALGLREFQTMVITDGLPRHWRAIYFLAAVVLPPAAYWGGPEALHMTLVGAVFAGFLTALLTQPLEPNSIARLSRCVLGWLYIPYMLSYALLLGRLEHARVFIFFVLVVLVAGDVGAYYTGKKLGRHKLNSVVSPNKTVEGSIGGLAASFLVGSLYGAVFTGGMLLVKLMILSILLEVVGQLGDLVESMLKRMCGIKDSGRLLPGHGGLLDRLDSLLFAFPAAWIVLQV